MNSVKYYQKKVDMYENGTPFMKINVYKGDDKTLFELKEKFELMKFKLTEFITISMEKAQIKVTMSPLFLSKLPLYPAEQEELEITEEAEESSE